LIFSAKICRRKKDKMSTNENENANETALNEKKYITITIPWLSIGRFILFVASIALATGMCILFSKFLQIARGNSVLIVEVIPWIFISYWIISLVPICFCAWIKKGFKNLNGSFFHMKKSVRHGIFSALQIYFIIGSAIGGVVSLIVMVIVFNIAGIIALIPVLIIAFVFALIYGIWDEFFS
jgi:hypothetical protein